MVGYAVQYQPGKPQKHIPLVADIYFGSKLAMESIRQGADKIKMNPSIIGSIERIKAVVEEVKTYAFSKKYRSDRNVRQNNLQSPIPAS